MPVCDSKYCLLWCHNGTGIQSGYVVARDECQDTAQDVVGYQNIKGNAKNTALLESFAKCMKKSGWGVTSPKKPNKPTGNINLAGDPWAPSPYGITRAPAPAQVPQSYGRSGGYAYAPASPPPGYAQSYDPYYQGQYRQAPQAPQNYGYGYAPQQSYYSRGYAPAPAPAAPMNYNYAPAPTAPAYSGQYGGSSPVAGYGAGRNSILDGPYSPANSNRAGIGLAPGF